MQPHSLLKLRERPEYAERAAHWFHEKWGIPLSAYEESTTACVRGGAIVPQWYLFMQDGVICAGAGVIENDFHNRKDLAPNVCAVYVEPEHRGHGLARALLDAVCADMAALGVKTLYLLTDHTDFYEHCGWRFLCMAQGDGEEQPARMYVHEME